MTAETNKLTARSLEYIIRTEEINKIMGDEKNLLDSNKISNLKSGLLDDSRWHRLTDAASNEVFQNNIVKIQDYWNTLIPTGGQLVSLNQELSKATDLETIRLNPNDTIEDVLNRGIMIHLFSPDKVKDSYCWFLVKIVDDSYGFRIVVDGPTGQPRIFETIDQLNQEIEEGLSKNNTSILHFYRADSAEEE